MASMKSWMLGVAIVAGAAGLGAMSAQAAEIGVYIGGPAAYVPPSPGPGFFWTAGYYANGYWMPGRWEFRGRVDRDDFYRYRDFDRDRYYDRGDRYRDHDRDRDRDHYRR